MSDIKKNGSTHRAFGPLSATFLGVGSMVGAGIFIVIGEAGAIAGNLVTVSFLIAGLIALLCGYSLSKLAIRYPSRGGIIEYLVQGYGEGSFSGALGILFYLAQLVALAAVSKSFGTYAATYIHGGRTSLYANLFAVGIVFFFVLINLKGASVVARLENQIVIVKLSILAVFTGVTLFFVHPTYLTLNQAPGAINIFYTLGLTFFAYQGFSVITNSIEDMDRPQRTMMLSMFLAVGLVAVLYISVSITVFGNLSLNQIIQDKDYALAVAARPVFGAWGFKMIAATALLATASAINATLYAVTQVSYTLAKEGNLPQVFDRTVFNNTEGLIISAALIVPLILFFNLAQIATVAAIAVLLIQGFTHFAHLLRRRETGANPTLILLAVVGSFGAAGFAIAHSSKFMPHLVYYISGIFLLSLAFEMSLHFLKGGRRIEKQIVQEIEQLGKDAFRRLR